MIKKNLFSSALPLPPKKMNLDGIEVKLDRMIDYTLITTLRKIELLTKRQVCKYCNIYVIEKEYKKTKDNKM